MRKKKSRKRICICHFFEDARRERTQGNSESIARHKHADIHLKYISWICLLVSRILRFRDKKAPIRKKMRSNLSHVRSQPDLWQRLAEGLKSGVNWWVKTEMGHKVMTTGQTYLRWLLSWRKIILFSLNVAVRHSTMIKRNQRCPSTWVLYVLNMII